MNMTFKIGERVRYCHSFLKSINADYEIAHQVGTVQSIKDINGKRIVKVLWDGDDEVRSSLSSNLAHMNYDVTE